MTSTFRWVLPSFYAIGAGFLAGEPHPGNGKGQFTAAKAHESFDMFLWAFYIQWS